MALPAAQIHTVAGTGAKADGGSGGPAIETNVGEPFGVEIGPDRALYFTEVANHRVRRLDPGSGELTTVAGAGRKGYSGDGGPAREATLNEPYEVRFDRADNIYFVEMQNHIVRRVDSRTGRIETIAGTGKPGFGGDGCPARNAQFQIPHSIALDDRGFLYVADIGNHRIRRIGLEAGTIDTIVGTGEKMSPRDGDAASGQPILGPRALFVSGRTLWIALREGNSIWRLDLESGRIFHVAGTGKKGFSGDGGPAKVAAFNGPKGIAVGPDDAVYVADTENQVIRRIDQASGVITAVAGIGGKAGYGGDNGDATKALLNRPHGICVAPDGTLYIGDTLSHRVRRVRFDPKD